MPQQKTYLNGKAGSAPLEFLMVLVPVLMFVVMLLWMASVSTVKSLVTIEARYDAWSKRDSEKGQPFEMQSYNQGEITSEKARKIDVSPLVNDLITPKSSHQLFTGTWHHPHVDLNQTPNWGLQRRLMTKAAQSRVAAIQDAGQAFGKMLDSLQDFSNINPSATADAFILSNGINSALGSLENGVKSELENIENERKESEEIARQKIEEEKRKHRETINKLKTENENDNQTIIAKRVFITRLNTQLEEEKQKEEPDEKRIEELEKQITKNNDEIIVLQNRINRRSNAIGELEKSKWSE